MTSNGVNFTQVIPGDQPDLPAAGSAGTINGLGTVSFNGSADVLAGSKSTGLQTVFIVDQPNSALYTNANGIFGENNADLSIRLASATSWANYGGSGNGQDFTGGAGSAMYINGVLQSGDGVFNANAPQLLEAVSASVDNFTAALADSYAGRYFGGTIGEVLVFNSTLTAAQQMQVDAYLNAKWLTSGTPSVSNNILPAASSVNLTGSGATLDLGTTNQTVASLAGVAGSSVNLESQTLTVTNASPTTFAGVMSGSGSLVINGSGTFTLTGANTLTGPTTITGGTLQLGDGSANNGSLAGNIVNNATLTFANPNSQTYSGVISGSGAVNKTGAGALTLSGTYTGNGTLTVNGGIVTLSHYQPFATTTIQSGTLLPRRRRRCPQFQASPTISTPPRPAASR